VHLLHQSIPKLSLLVGSILLLLLLLPRKHVGLIGFLLDELSILEFFILFLLELFLDLLGEGLFLKNHKR